MCSGAEFYYSRFLEARSLTKLHLQLIGMLSLLDSVDNASAQRHRSSEQVSEMTKQSQKSSITPEFGHTSPVSGLNLEVPERLN